jgi:hypothetical protein
MYCATLKISLAPFGGVSYTAERQLPNVKSYTVQLPFGGVRYTANWRQVYFVLYILNNSQNKLGTSWQYILHYNPKRVKKLKN